MEVTKTVRVPLHYALTKRKLSILEHLTARLTYCVWIFSNLIEERNMNVGGYGEFAQSDIAQVKAQTKLGIAYVQQCRDQALWMWRSYREQHEEWERRLKYGKSKWREKLLKREPHKPLHDGLTNKIPVRIDVRSGIVERSRRIALSPYVLCLSTMKKHHGTTIPLNPGEYHLELLKKGRIVDFQLVKKNRWYYVHVCMKYDAPEHPAGSVLAVDLGVRRAMATVLLKPNQPLRRDYLSILKDGEKKHRLEKLNGRIKELQRGKKWTALKRLGHKCQL